MKLLVTLEPDETGMLVAIVGCLETRAANGMPLS